MSAPEKLRKHPNEVMTDASISPIGLTNIPQKVSTVPQMKPATHKIYEILSLVGRSLKLNAILLFLVLL